MRYYIFATTAKDATTEHYKYCNIQRKNYRAGFKRVIWGFILDEEVLYKAHINKLLR